MWTAFIHCSRWSGYVAGLLSLLANTQWSRLAELNAPKWRETIRSFPLCGVQCATCRRVPARTSPAR